MSALREHFRKGMPVSHGKARVKSETRHEQEMLRQLDKNHLPTLQRPIRLAGVDGFKAAGAGDIADTIVSSQQREREQWPLKHQIILAVVVGSDDLIRRLAILNPIDNQRKRIISIRAWPTRNMFDTYIRYQKKPI